jgi:hypothetical protein
MTEQEILKVRKDWEDATMKGADYVKNFVSHLMQERSQLYGALIHTMLTHDIDVVNFPPMDEFREYGKKYYVLFEEDPETHDFRFRLLEQENND